MVTRHQHQRHQVYGADALLAHALNQYVHFRVALHRANPRRKALGGHHMVEAGVGGKGVMAGTVAHKHHLFVGVQRGHLLGERVHQAHVVVMPAQQRRPEGQAFEQRAQALHFTGDFFVFVAVDDVQRLYRHIVIAEVREFLQRLKRGIGFNTIAGFQLADDHPRGKSAEQVTVGAACRQLAFAGNNILLAGVMVAGTKTHHQ